MGFESEFLDLMPDTIAFKAPDGTFTDRGAPNFGASKDYAGRIVEKNVTIFDKEGQERVSSVTVWLATTDVLSPEGELTLPADFTPQSPPIMAIERYPDGDGAHHTVLRVSAVRGGL